MIFSLALRNLFRHWERFRVLLATLILGGTVSVIIMGVTTSMTTTLSEKAARYFAGNVMVMGYNKDMDRLLDHEEILRKGFTDSGLPIQSYCRRTIYYNNDAVLFFAGASQRERRLIGVDWALETENFKKMDFVSGGPEKMVEGKGILVSDSAADKLKMRVGDDCLVLLTTKTGQKNTVTLKVEGVFRESSFFGYSSYMDIKDLNRAIGLPGNALTEFGITLPQGVSEEWAADRVRSMLIGKVPVISAARTSGELDKILEKENIDNTRRFGVLTLNIRLAQIKDILDALLLVGWMLNAIFLLIVMIGVNNTYRMVVFERTREIGTMRALGMTKTRLAGLFLTESVFLGLSGAILGWVLGSLLLFLATWIDFGGNVLVAMFLERGKFVWNLPLGLTVFVFFSMIVASLAGALEPAVKSAVLRPVDALRQES